MGSNSTTIPTTSVAELKYLSLLARDYPTQAAAASAVISLEATAKLPKGTEHYISDLHGEDEAFIHLLNSASGVIREKVDLVLGENVPKAIRAELATLIYYPARKLPLLKARYPERFELEAWYRQTLLRLIDVCRFVSSKHTREYVRSCLPQGCGHIIDELLHAHFEDHNKTLYYGQIVGSIIANDRADAFIIRLCELIKRLAVDKLHIIGDLFDRGPRPDLILDRLMTHHNVDFQWGNHDVVWMGAAAGSALCCCTVLKTTLAYHNHGMIEDFYGINLRHLLRMAEQYYGNEDLTIWMPHTDATRGPYTDGMLHRCAVMHKAITILMLKLECEVIDIYLSDMRKSEIDTLILGCTHYPLLRSRIMAYFGESVHIVNPAYETAMDLKKILEEQKIANTSGEPAAYDFYVSDAAEKFKKFANSILPYDVDKTQAIDIEDY